MKILLFLLIGAFLISLVYYSSIFLHEIIHLYLAHERGDAIHGFSVKTPIGIILNTTDCFIFNFDNSNMSCNDYLDLDSRAKGFAYINSANFNDEEEHNLVHNIEIIYIFIFGFGSIILSYIINKRIK